MKSTKLNLTHEGNKIYFHFIDPEFSKLGFADYTDKLWEIINISNWHIRKGKYIYSSKGKSLHRTVMEYYYGEEHYERMNKNGFVIDHIDNDGFNCLIENLAFLNRIKNWHYKGNYYDKERLKKLPIAAINIFRKKDGKKFQITIGFNAKFTNSNGETISKAFFIYDTDDYDLVLADALFLVESVGNRRIEIKHLRCNKLKWEPVYYIKTNNVKLKGGSVININGKWGIVRGDEVQVFKIAPDDELW